MSSSPFHFWLLSCMLFMGCQHTSVPVKSQITLPEHYQQATMAQGKSAIQQWWQHWQDPQLNALITRGLKTNLTLAQARSQLAEARAIMRLARANFFPLIVATAQANQAHLDLEHRDLSSRLIQSGINITWEPDIFGQKQSDFDATQAGVRLAQAQFYAIQMSTANEIAHAYLHALHIEKQRTLLQQTDRVLKRFQGYLRERFHAGHVTSDARYAIQSQIQGLKSKYATLDAQFATYQRAIAVLIGELPQHLQLNIAQMKKQDILTHLPLPPQGQKPSELLQQRPDLQARIAHIQKQAAHLASAKADLFPRFTLQFLWQHGQIQLDNQIPAFNTWQTLLNARLQLPIFTAGRIHANIERADQQLKQALLDYDQTLLRALADVENHYQQQFALNKQAQLLQQHLHLHQKQINDAEQHFRYGNYTFDQIMQARLSALAVQEKLLENQLAQGINLIGLYQAIGLGWQEIGPE